uniref:Zinc finger protein 840 isoform X1 n=1 Tax=Diabrotica virgifera virgifera TaxID=50390 RepID=A0A6P7G846_DIAVI
MDVIQENCRLCQIYIGTVPLNEELSQIIFDVSRIKVNDHYRNLLPVNICEKCNTVILETNTYLKEIKRVNTVLVDYLENTKIKAENSLPFNENSEINNCDVDFNNTGDTPNRNVLDNIESIESHICPICSQKFSRKTNYLKHKRKHPQLYCKNCHTFFEEQVKSENHICKLHIKRKKNGVKIKVEPKSEDIKDTEHRSEDLLHYQCNQCLKQCENKRSYKTHIQTHEKFTCNEENCSKVYASLYSLKTHKLIHEGKRPFLCVVCGK